MGVEGFCTDTTLDLWRMRHNQTFAESKNKQNYCFLSSESYPALSLSYKHKNSREKYIKDFKGGSAGDICTPRCMVALFISPPTDGSSPMVMNTWRHKELYERQTDMTWEDEPPGQQGSNMLPGKSREIAPERMKSPGQSGNDIQLCMCLVVKVKSDAIKNNIA